MKCPACGIEEAEEIVISYVHDNPSKEDDKETFYLCASCKPGWIEHLVIKPQ